MMHAQATRQAASPLKILLLTITAAWARKLIALSPEDSLARHLWKAWSAASDYLVASSVRERAKGALRSKAYLTQNHAQRTD